MAKKTYDVGVAIGSGDFDTLKRLVEADSTCVNRRLGDGSMPITRAAPYPKFLRFLLESGADASSRDESSEDTALMIACRDNCVESVKLLIAAGVDVNALGSRQYTPLCEAVNGPEDDRLVIVKALLDAGADVHRGRFPPITRAMSEASVEMVELLLDSGADVNSATARGSALICAIAANRPEIVELLLKRGADTTLKSREGLTAIEFARQEKRKRIVELLSGSVGSTATSDKPNDLQSVWSLLEACLMKKGSKVASSLQPGAKAAAFAAFEEEIGIPLPAAVRESWTRHDGQKPGPKTGLASDGREDDLVFVLMPLKSVTKSWERLCEALSDGDFVDLKPASTAGIRKEIYNPSWIPFAENGAGDYLCLDLAPAKGGKAGQVITFYHESSERRKLADSFGQWLADVLEHWKN